MKVPLFIPFNQFVLGNASSVHLLIDRIVGDMKLFKSP